ncbi:hypothetical protein J2754_001178 [Halarchaeum solikamskense]|nr:hypothetical protein [Halarchaeum solikamskense]
MSDSTDGARDDANAAIDTVADGSRTHVDEATYDATVRVGTKKGAAGHVAPGNGPQGQFPLPV